MDKINKRVQSSRLPYLLMAIVVVGVLVAMTALLAIETPQQDRLATPTPAPTATALPFAEVDLRYARGYRGDGWELYFTQPGASRDIEDYKGGIDSRLAAAMAAAEESVDMAIFQLSSPVIIDAILGAHGRGLAVRLVVDDDYDEDALAALAEAGVPIVDDDRSGRMHNKFTIIDGKSVWTGSWNYTLNGAYRHNNNAIALHDAAVAAAYQAEFDEMFERREFGVRSTNQGPVSLAAEGREIDIVFAAEGDEIPWLVNAIRSARDSVRFMIFSFSLEEVSGAMIEANAKPGVTVSGVFDVWQGGASWSQLSPLHCAGVDVREDGNRDLMHHKLIIVDDELVVTGSFNFSKSAADSNDENILILRDPVIGALYADEFRRVWDVAKPARAEAESCD